MDTLSTYRAVILALVLGMLSSFYAPGALAAWQDLMDEPAPVGSGQLKKFGFLIYDAQLYAPQGQFQADQPFALTLTYARTIAKDRIVSASLDEIENLGIDITAHPPWRAELEAVLVDVKEGDQLTGVYLPEQGAVFFYNGQRTGRLSDALAKAFFAIWLDPKTSAPDLRTALLGQ